MLSLRLSHISLPALRCTAPGRRSIHAFIPISRLSNKTHLLPRARGYSLVPEKQPEDSTTNNTVLFSYEGPLTETWKRLKIFSFSSLGFATALTPFMFIIDSSLPTGGRAMLGGVAMLSSIVSTGLIGYCAAPYATHIALKRDGSATITTKTLFLKELHTTVYDTAFLGPASRFMSIWQLRKELWVGVEEPRAAQLEDGLEETIAETLNHKGERVGWWAVKWTRDGNDYVGHCIKSGQVVEAYNVQRNLIPDNFNLPT